MNQEERNELRKKHSIVQLDFGDCCLGCDQPYPCDVIKVLDALESRNGLVNPAQTDTCDHTDWTRGSYSDGIYVDMGYRYCPKCGEKL